MNKREVFDLVQKIELLYNYPFTRHVPDGSKEKRIAEVVTVWHEMLHDQDAKIVNQKLMNHVRENRFPPTIAELYEHKEPSRINHEHLAKMRALRGEAFYDRTTDELQY